MKHDVKNYRHNISIEAENLNDEPNVEILELFLLGLVVDLVVLRPENGKVILKYTYNFDELCEHMMMMLHQMLPRMNGNGCDDVSYNQLCKYFLGPYTHFDFLDILKNIIICIQTSKKQSQMYNFRPFSKLVTR